MPAGNSVIRTVAAFANFNPVGLKINGYIGFATIHKYFNYVLKFALSKDLIY
jgi:hypothetical protein